MNEKLRVREYQGMYIVCSGPHCRVRAKPEHTYAMHHGSLTLSQAKSFINQHHRRKTDGHSAI